MTNFIKKFASDTSGAVTVDWVVLTAAIVGLGMAAGVLATVALGDGSGEINTLLEDIDPSVDPFAEETPDDEGDGTPEGNG